MGTDIYRNRRTENGLRLRSVLKNLIDAPQKTAEKLILELAYGDLTAK